MSKYVMFDSIIEINTSILASTIETFWSHFLSDNPLVLWVQISAPPQPLRMHKAPRLQGPAARRSLTSAEPEVCHH